MLIVAICPACRCRLVGRYCFVHLGGGALQAPANISIVMPTIAYNINSLLLIIHTPFC